MNDGYGVIEWWENGFFVQKTNFYRLRILFSVFLCLFKFWVRTKRRRRKKKFFIFFYRYEKKWGNFFFVFLFFYIIFLLFSFKRLVCMYGYKGKVQYGYETVERERVRDNRKWNWRRKILGSSKGK